MRILIIKAIRSLYYTLKSKKQKNAPRPYSSVFFFAFKGIQVILPCKN